MKKTIFLLAVVVIACQNKNSDEPLIPRSEYLGSYCGEDSAGGSWRQINTEITPAPDNKSGIIISELISQYDTVNVLVKNDSLLIPVQTISYNDNPDDKMIFKGTGKFRDEDKSMLQIDYAITAIRPGYADENVIGRMNLFNQAKYTHPFTGTYTGDSTRIIISSVNDILYASVYFPVNWEPSGFEHLMLEDRECYFHIQADSVTDLSSGEYYKVLGSLLKLGDMFKISMIVYYHGYGPLYLYNFKVKKQV